MARYFVLAFLVLVFLSPNAEAATLFGRVIEVNDGDVITVFNLNRPVRIKLMAIDAPEAAQPFGDVARKHLADLVYDKSVLVEYWGLGADGSLVGRVTLNNVDVGAQMIRDGAAWFDASNQAHLTAADRDVYQKSEQAARTERRGLWQAENPIAPWEFVRAQSLRRNPAASLNSIFPAEEGSNGPAPELNRMTLLAAGMAGPLVGSRNDPWRSFAAANWRLYKPVGQNFSALFPVERGHSVLEIPSRGQTLHLQVSLAREGWSRYALIWITTPTDGETDEVAVDEAVRKFLEGFGTVYESQTNTAFSCELGEETRGSSNGYSRTDFDLKPCTVPGKVRAYTRVVNGNRQMYIALAFYLDEDEHVARFLQSFNISPPRPKAKKR